MSSGTPAANAVTAESRALWLEVGNVRRTRGRGDLHPLEVQFKADRTDRTERDTLWWRVTDQATSSDPDGAYRAVSDALDKKRLVLGELMASGGQLVCGAIRVQFGEPPAR